MFFPFSFNFSIPGILNPFAVAAPTHLPAQAHGEQNKNIYNNDTRTHQSPTSRSLHTALQGRDTLFSAPAYPAPSPSTYPAAPSYPLPLPVPANTRRISRSQLPKIPRRHSPSPPPSSSAASLRALPLSRKRGWEPTFGAESIQSLASSGNLQSKSSSTTSLSFTSPSGYLDTPAKYRDIAEDITMSDDHYRESLQGDNDDDAPPPMKKRRGLAGSIVSTAVSAALIGTAVGLTVYRLWRDRGRDAQIANAPHGQEADADSDADRQAPPPPYDAGHWRAAEVTQQPDVSAPSLSQQPTATTRTVSVPPTPGTPTPRSGSARVKRAGAGGARRSQHVAHSSVRRTRTPKVGLGVVGSPRTRPEFDFGRGEEEVGVGVGQTEVEDKMDWMGDKLSMLIEQGRRALQAEVVVMSEAKEDEVDDGRGGWEEEEEGFDNEDEDEDGDDGTARYGRARSGSVRSLNARSVRAKAKAKARPRNVNTVPAPGSVGSSPVKVGLGLSGVPSSSSSSYVSGSRSGSPRRSGGGFAPSYAAAAGTAYTPAHAHGSVPSASVSASPSPFYTASFERGGYGHGHVRGVSYESALFASPVRAEGGGEGEDVSAWESPELKASMERARARMLARRAGAGV